MVQKPETEPGTFLVRNVDYKNITFVLHSVSQQASVLQTLMTHQRLYQQVMISSCHSFYYVKDIHGSIDSSRKQLRDIMPTPWLSISLRNFSARGMLTFQNFCLSPVFMLFWSYDQNWNKVNPSLSEFHHRVFWPVVCQLGSASTFLTLDLKCS